MKYYVVDAEGYAVKLSSKLFKFADKLERRAIKSRRYLNSKDVTLRTHRCGK